MMIREECQWRCSIETGVCKPLGVLIWKEAVTKSCDSSVGIALGCRLDDQGSRV
jgi:hypothetical protein